MCIFPLLAVVKKSPGVDHSDSSAESPQTSMYKDRDSSDPELNQFVDAPSSLPKVWLVKTLFTHNTVVLLCNNSFRIKLKTSKN